MPRRGGAGCARLVVPLVLLSVGPGKLDDRLIEGVAPAEVGGQRDAVPRAGVRSCQCPAAHLGVERQARASWVGLVLVALGVFVASLPAYVAQRQAVCTGRTCASFLLTP